MVGLFKGRYERNWLKAFWVSFIGSFGGGTMVSLLHGERIAWLENNNGQATSATAAACASGSSVLACAQTAWGYSAIRQDPSTGESWSERSLVVEILLAPPGDPPRMDGVLKTCALDPLMDWTSESCNTVWLCWSS